MGQTLLAAMATGLALAGALAIAGVGAGRFGRGVPHIGLGGLGGAAAVVAGRLGDLPGPLLLLAVAGTGALLGCVACVLDRRAREVDAPVWPPALLPEAAVLGLALAVGGVLRPAAAIDLPLGPLGGLASTTGSVVAFIVGVGVAALASTQLLSRRAMPAWALVVAGTAVAVTLGAGGIAIRGEVLIPAIGMPDIVGLALRAAAVGVFARRGLWPGLAAALVLGGGEALLRSQLSTGEAALLPVLAVLAWSVWRARTVAVPAAA